MQVYGALKRLQPTTVFYQDQLLKWIWDFSSFLRKSYNRTNILRHSVGRISQIVLRWNMFCSESQNNVDKNVCSIQNFRISPIFYFDIGKELTNLFFDDLNTCHLFRLFTFAAKKRDSMVVHRFYKCKEFESYWRKKCILLKKCKANT